MPRVAVTLVVGAMVLVGATTVHGPVPATRDQPPPARNDPGIGSVLGYAGPPATASSPRPTEPTSVSPSPAGDDATSPVGSGAGIIVLVAIGGAFLWLRARALRR